MLISNNFSINNQQIYKNQSNPIKCNQPIFKGLEDDTFELSATNKDESNKKMSNREKAFYDLMKFGFSEEQSFKLIVAVNSLDNYENEEETYEYMVKDVPEIEDNDIRKQFIIRRFQAMVDTKNQGDDIFDKTTPKVINKDRFKFFTDTFKKYPSLQSQASLDNLTTVAKLYDKNKFDDINKYIDNNEDAPVLLLAVAEKDYDKEDKIFSGLKKFLKTGCSKDILTFQFKMLLEKDKELEEEDDDDDDDIYDQINVFNNADNFCEKIEYLKKYDINPRFVLNISATDLTLDQAHTLAKFMDKVCEHRTELGSPDMPVDDVELASIFVNNESAKKTLNTINILGEDNFIKMFPMGFDTIDDIVDNLGEERLIKEKMEPLKELVNPTESNKYKEAQDNIENLKQGFNNITDKKERDERIKKMNDANNIKKDIVNKSIKDPIEKANAIKIYLGAIDNNGCDESDYESANDLIPYFRDNNDGGKRLNEKLKSIVWKNYAIIPTKETESKINLKPDARIQKLMFPSPDFHDNFSRLIGDLNANPDKSIKETLDNLPHNKNFKDNIETYGFDYDVWTGANPDLKVNVNIDYDFDKMSKNAIKNLEAEFNDDIFKSLPQKQQNNLKKSLEKGGYELKDSENIVYEGDGYFAGTDKLLKLYKDNKPIEFKDLSKIYKLLNTEFSTNSYWNLDDTNENIPTAKGTFKNHIDTRHEEMKRIRQQKSSESSNITIQKVDMDNISHSLFLGNDATCCTAIGSFNDWSAPNYIRNKMVQAIELKDGDESIGNTMMYLVAISPEKMGLLLDNIELKPKYQYNEKIEDGIVEFSKQFAKKLGKPDMDIYAGPNRHKLDMKNFELTDEKFQIFGETDGQPVYLDFITKGMPIDYDTFEGSILKLNKN